MSSQKVNSSFLEKSLISINVVLLLFITYEYHGIFFSKKDLETESVTASVSTRKSVFKKYQKAIEKLKPRWSEDKLPITIIAPLSMKEELEKSLSDACAVWNEGAKRRLLTYSFEDYDPTDTTLFSDEEGNGKIYFPRKWSDVSKKKGFLAITAKPPTENPEVIESATIAFNGNYSFHRDIPDDTNREITILQYDFDSVLIHELGHFLGLRHTKDNTSVMRDFVKSGKIFRKLSPRDIDEIYLRYN